jgi:hypothetical protein
MWDMLPPEPPDLDNLEPPDPGDGQLSLFGSEPEYGPSNTWERYLASQSPDQDSDAAEVELSKRAAEMGLVDARFIGMEHQTPAGQTVGYSIGCIEAYNDGSASYLEVGYFDELAEVMEVYQQLQTPIDKGWIAPHSVHEFAEFAAGENEMLPEWREASSDEESVYSWYAPDRPSLDVHDAAQKSARDEGVFSALSAIGVKPEDFDPSQDPPPYYDPETGTAYWIGIFQPDMDDPVHCVASILSLGRNEETGELEAQLAPCVPGDWDKTYASSQHLLGVMERDGLEACFLAAESMAIATDQRDLWNKDRGMVLGEDYAHETADYTRHIWGIEL